MIYGPDDIQVITDAVAVVRRRPSMYVGAQATAANLADRLRDDALLLGATRAVIDRHEDWTIVAADVDWLRIFGSPRYACTPEELFRRIVPIPEAGPNSMRGEVLVAAFASDVVSSTPHESFVVTGVVPADASIWRAVRREGIERSIAFRGIISPE